MFRRVSTWRPKLFTLLLIVPLAFVLLCAVLFAGGKLLSRIINPITRSTDCTDVARAFAHALVSGDARVARSLSSGQTRTDNWISQRRGFVCPFSLDIESSVGSTVCGQDERGDPDKWNCGFTYTCTLRGGYLFNVDDIELELGPDGCRVTHSSEPCEVYGWEHIGVGECP